MKRALLILALGISGASFAQAPAKSEEKLTVGNMTLGKDAVERIITRKLKMLADYFAILCMKSDPNPPRVIQQAMALFNHDESKRVTVTSLNNSKVAVKPVKTYLTDMSKLPYKSVEVKNSKIYAVNDLVKQPDGSFRGTITFEQEFTGYDSEHRPIYSDRTQKRVQVIVKVTDVIKNGAVAAYLDIFFGDMSVTDTRR